MVLVSFIERLKKIFIISSDEIKFVMFFKKRIDKKKTPEYEGQLLMDAMDFHPYMFRTAFVREYFCKEYKLQAKTIVTNFGRKGRFFTRAVYPFSRLRRIYESLGFGDGLVYGNLSHADNNDINRRVTCIMDDIHSKEDLVDLVVDGVKIGDLIYDSYLRIYECATINLDDVKVIDLIREALIIFYSSRNYLKTNDVKKVILSHAVYIQYGILARIAVHFNIDVYLFSRWDIKVVHKLTKNHYLQTNNHLKYRVTFQELENKPDKLKKAREILTKRLSGVIDAGTAYMKVSAYGDVFDSKTVFENTGKPRVVVMLHCFYDSPHIYKDMLFPDFYEWLDFTLNVAIKTDFDVYVKPHPNGIPGNEKVVKYFKRKFPKVSFIDKNISNNQIVSEGIDAVITVYGTLGHEFPYMGVPAITAGDNPHSGYDFCNHARSLKEYEFFIKNIPKLQKNISKRDVEEFFYMHYLSPIDGRLEGSNDLFFIDKNKSNQKCGLKKTTLMADLVAAAEEGDFDGVFGKFKVALEVVDN